MPALGLCAFHSITTKYGPGHSLAPITQSNPMYNVLSSSQKFIDTFIPTRLYEREAIRSSAWFSFLTPDSRI